MGSAQSSVGEEERAVHRAARSSIESDIKNRQNIDECVKKWESRIAAASTLVPILDNSTLPVQAVNHVVENLMEKVLSIKQAAEDYERTHPGGPALSFVEGQPSLKITTEGFNNALSSLQKQISSFSLALSHQHDEARKTLETGPAMVRRLRDSRAAIEDSMKASYELLHPVHRFPIELIKNIFSLLVHDEFDEARKTLATQHRLPTLTATKTLYMVCSRWKAIIDASPELWQFVALVDSGSTFFIKKSESHRDISVLARGSQFPKLSGLTERFNIKELIVDCGEITALQPAIHSLPTLTRLLISYTGAESPSVRINLPSNLPHLHTLSCYRIFPEIPDHLLISLRTLSLAKFDHYPCSSTIFWQFLRQAPLLMKLVILETEIKGVPVALHNSIESITTNKPFKAGALKARFPRLASLKAYTDIPLRSMVTDAKYAHVMNDLQVSI
jgi:hypothetical protein